MPISFQILDVRPPNPEFGSGRRVQTLRTAAKSLGLQEVDQHADLGIVVSWPSLRLVPRSSASIIWFDACDSARMLRLSRARRREWSQLGALIRDRLSVTSYRRKIDVVTYVTTRDLKADLSLWNGHIVPLPNVYQRLTPGKAKSPRLVFTGHCAYRPNQDAFGWISRNLVKKLRHDYPDLELHVYGNARNLSLGSSGEGIIFHDMTAISEIYQTEDVHLAPVRSGAGLQNKVIEPLIAGLRVVATPLAAADLHSPNLIVSRLNNFDDATRNALEKPAVPDTEIVKFCDLDMSAVAQIRNALRITG